MSDAVRQPLLGISVVVTRAQAQASTLVAKLESLGATAIEVPVIAIAAPADGGAALRAALHEASRYDWLVVTSANGADALVDAAGGTGTLRGAKVAVVGSATAERLAARGIEAALVPQHFVAEGLLDAFPPPSSGATGRVLVAQAEEARDVLVSGLAAAGWQVDTVVAYRTVPAALAAEDRARVQRADAITFTSSSTVDRFLDAFDRSSLPPVVACIGPITAGTARARGVEVTVVAETHTVDGLVDALVRRLAS